MKKCLFFLVSFFCFFEIVCAQENTVETLLEENRLLKEELQVAMERASYFSLLSDDLQKEALALFDEVTLLKSQLVILDEYTRLVQEYAEEIDRLRLLHYEDQQLLQHYDSLFSNIESTKKELEEKMEVSEKEKLHYLELQKIIEMERNELFSEREKVKEESDILKEKLDSVGDQLSLKEKENAQLLQNIEEKKEKLVEQKEIYEQQEMMLRKYLEDTQKSLFLKEEENTFLREDLEKQKSIFERDKNQLFIENQNCKEENIRYEKERGMFQKVQKQKKVCEEREVFLSSELEQKKKDVSILKEELEGYKMKETVQNTSVLSLNSSLKDIREEEFPLKMKTFSFLFPPLLLLGCLSFLCKNRRKKSKKNKF